MKILRSVTRRGYTVGTAGWFTITSPNRWFAASRLPRASRYLSEEFQTMEEPGALRRSADPLSSQAASAPRITTINSDARHPLRQMLIVLLAIAITLLLLYWLSNPR